MRRILMAAAVLAAAAFMTTRPSASTAPGAVYTSSNDAGGNEVLVYDRAANGRLTLVGAVPTGGFGSGGGLGNQGALRLSRDGRLLVVVNAGSHDISVFSVTNRGLALRDREPSGGLRPISVTLDGSLLYVLNAGGAVGGADTVSGFRLSRDGQLSAIAGSTRPLSAMNVGPAQVELSPDGRSLVVTEKATNVITAFPVNHAGTLDAPTFYASAGMTPFGFAFGKRGQFFVTEAFGGAVEASTVSSYQIADDGQVQTISPAVPTTETAACWLAITNSGRFLYVTNTGSSSVSGYSVEPDGTIALLHPGGVSGSTGAGSAPIDLAFSVNDQYVYALSGGTHTITAFRIRPHGELDLIETTTGLPPASTGLVAR